MTSSSHRVWSAVRSRLGCLQAVEELDSEHGNVDEEQERGSEEPMETDVNAGAAPQDCSEGLLHPHEIDGTLLPRSACQ